MTEHKIKFLTLPEIRRIATSHKVDWLNLAGKVDTWQQIISGESGPWAPEKVQETRQALEQAGIDVNRIKPST